MVSGEVSCGFHCSSNQRPPYVLMTVVSEARFQAYRRTGILPPDTPADMAEEIAAGGHPAERDPAGPAGNGAALLATGKAAGSGREAGPDAEPESRSDER